MDATAQRLNRVPFVSVPLLASRARGRIVCGTGDGQMRFLTLRNFGTGKLEMEKTEAKLK